MREGHRWAVRFEALKVGQVVDGVVVAVLHIKSQHQSDLDSGGNVLHDAPIGNGVAFQHMRLAGIDVSVLPVGGRRRRRITRTISDLFEVRLRWGKDRELVHNHGAEVIGIAGRYGSSRELGLLLRGALQRKGRKGDGCKGYGDDTKGAERLGHGNSSSWAA